MPWVTAYFYRQLLQADVEIFEYTQSILHAKTAVIDNWAILGSSNLNHRSFRHDLEVDYLVQCASTTEQLVRDFNQDILSAEPQTLGSLPKKKRYQIWMGGIILKVLGPWI